MVYQRKRLKVESAGRELVFLEEYDRSLLVRVQLRPGSLTEFLLGEEDMRVLRGMLDVQLDRIDKSRELTEEFRRIAELAESREPEPRPEQPEGLPEF